MRFRLRREPFRWFCPVCGGIFATIHVSMDRRFNKLPRLRSMRGDIRCDECGAMDSELNFMNRSRGWPEQDEVTR